MIFNQIKRNKGVIKVLICVNGGEIFPQTLLKYKGDWRLYINTKILPNSPSRIGELLDIKLNLDFEDREIKMPIDLKGGLEKNPQAKEIFDNIDKIEDIKDIDNYLPSDLRVTKDQYQQAMVNEVYRTQTLVKIKTALTILSQQTGVNNQ